MCHPFKEENGKDGSEAYIGEIGSQSGFYVGGTEQIVVVKPWTIEGVEIMGSSPLK
ncbi:MULTISPECIES: hypothetical protein [unclassified Pseudomonas]|uniref:hypothetical protein n=1 Tax=unclassified Pseudomonas TaxID=196821 RepID=UPI0015A3FAC7|nr:MULTISPECIES: hypothetical protein [unclassified Pseudomonas]NWC93015.1 hypothetical protein [Pseudomonas sp. IPO3779]NWD19433.1 hypothetical protein [Pseudomonas sp. IPO3778]